MTDLSPHVRRCFHCPMMQNDGDSEHHRNQRSLLWSFPDRLCQNRTPVPLFCFRRLRMSPALLHRLHHRRSAALLHRHRLRRSAVRSPARYLPHSARFSVLLVHFPPVPPFSSSVDAPASPCCPSALSSSVKVVAALSSSAVIVPTLFPSAL